MSQNPRARSSPTMQKVIQMFPMFPAPQGLPTTRSTAAARSFPGASRTPHRGGRILNTLRGLAMVFSLSLAGVVHAEGPGDEELGFDDLVVTADPGESGAESMSGDPRLEGADVLAPVSPEDHLAAACSPEDLEAAPDRTRLWAAVAGAGALGTVGGLMFRRATLPLLLGRHLAGSGRAATAVRSGSGHFAAGAEPAGFSRFHGGTIREHGVRGEPPVFVVGKMERGTLPRYGEPFRVRPQETSGLRRGARVGFHEDGGDLVSIGARSGGRGAAPERAFTRGVERREMPLARERASVRGGRERGERPMARERASVRGGMERGERPMAREGASVRGAERGGMPVARERASVRGAERGGMQVARERSSVRGGMERGEMPVAREHASGPRGMERGERPVAREHASGRRGMESGERPVAREHASGRQVEPPAGPTRGE